MVSISELVSRAVTKGKTSKTALVPGFCGGSSSGVSALISTVLNSAYAYLDSEVFNETEIMQGKYHLYVLSLDKNLSKCTMF